MPTVNSVTANPATITKAQTSTVTVAVSNDADKQQKVVGTVAGSSPLQQAEVVITVKPNPIKFVTDPLLAQPGDILVTAPDGGTLVATANPGVYTFKP